MEELVELRLFRSFKLGDPPLEGFHESTDIRLGLKMTANP